MTETQKTATRSETKILEKINENLEAIISENDTFMVDRQIEIVEVLLQKLKANKRYM